MPLKLTAATSITFLDSQFVQIINDILQESTVDVSGGVILNFHVPAQSKNHPVEISIDRRGNLRHFILFANSGIPPVAELVWDLNCDRFSQLGRDFDLECGRSMLGLYTRNFCAYLENGAYEVTVTPQFDRSLSKSIHST
jgi:hypothetical protein